jgi:hypothetical protein
MKQDAGREGVQYEVAGEILRLYYPPRTQVVIGQKQADGKMAAKATPIGPPDGVMARICVVDYTIETNEREEVCGHFEFSLDRECVPVLDSGGPWIREHRNLEELNVYLSLFGLEASAEIDEEVDIAKLNVQVVPVKEPQDLCDHELDLYLLDVTEVQFMGGEGYVVDADVPCGRCGSKRNIRFTIPEEVVDGNDDET